MAPTMDGFGRERTGHDNGVLATEDHYQSGYRLTHRAWDDRGALIAKVTIDVNGPESAEVQKIRRLYR